MKVTTFTDFLHHIVDHTNFDSEEDYRTSHALIDQQFSPVAPVEMINPENSLANSDTPLA